jgi:hypothetical protein
VWPFEGGVSTADQQCATSREGTAPGEVMTALARAVTDQCLAVEEYSSILEVVQTNPEVREKIRQRIRPSDK